MNDAMELFNEAMALVFIIGIIAGLVIAVVAVVLA